jgi:hypothetical protein
MKSLDAAALDALEAGRFAVRSLVLFDLPSGRWGAWDDHYNLSWGGDTYVGATGRFTLQIPPGTSDLSVRGLTATFSGLDSAALVWAQDQSYHQRPMFAAIAIIAPETPQVISVRRWFSGYVDQVRMQEKVDGEARIVVQCESHSRELDRAGTRIRADADQRALGDPEDGFFQHTVAAIATDVGWGTNIPQPPAPRRPWWKWW